MKKLYIFTLYLLHCTQYLLYKYWNVQKTFNICTVIFTVIVLFQLNCKLINNRIEDINCIFIGHKSHFYIFIFLNNITYAAEKYIQLRIRLQIPFVLSNWSHAGSKQKKKTQRKKKAYTQDFAILITVVRSYDYSLICLKRAFVRDGSARVARNYTGWQSAAKSA